MLDKLNWKTAAGGAALLFLVSAVFISANSLNNTDNFIPYPDKASSQNNDINMSQGEKQGFLSFLDFSIPYLSSVSGPESVEPGEQIEFRSDVDAKESFDMDGTVNIVEIYRCQDSSCENGEFVEAAKEFNSWDFTLQQGSGFTWTTTYSVPSETGWYAATSYISDGSGGVLTDTPRYRFAVGDVDTGDGDSGGDDGSDEEDGSDDSSGGSDEEDTNQPPEIESVDAPLVVNASEPFTVSVEASDPDSTDLTYSWSNGKEGKSIILNYGETGVKELDVEVSDGDNTVTSTVRVKVEDETAVTDPEPANPLTSFWNWFTGLFS